MYYIPLLFSIACLFIGQKSVCDTVITLFFRDYPAVEESHAQKLSERLGSNKKLARHQIERIAHHNLRAGIFGTYAGFVHASDVKGQLTFPRKHTRPFLYVIITPSIIPILMLDNTVHHWELAPGAPYAVYTYERKKDKETKQYFWEVQQLPELKNHVIPLESLVIFAQPHYIYIPTGITLTKDNPNLILPDIYVKKGFNLINNSLYVLNISQYLGQANRFYQKKPTSYQVQTNG
jgi:hypothetical protein